MSHCPRTRRQRYQAHQGAVLSTWEPQCSNDFADQQAPGEPEDTADGDKGSALENMQLDDAPNAAAPQPTDKPAATQAEAAEGSAAAQMAACCCCCPAVLNGMSCSLA